jgi:hypothetical protein
MSSPPGTRILSPGWKRLSGWAPGSCWERLAKHRMAPAATTRQHAEPALVTPAHGIIVLCIPASQRQEGSGRRLLAGPWSAIAGKLSLSLQQLQKAADYFTDLSHDYSSSLSEGADAVGCTPGVGSTRRAEIRWLWLNTAQEWTGAVYLSVTQIHALRRVASYDKAAQFLALGTTLRACRGKMRPTCQTDKQDESRSWTFASSALSPAPAGLTKRQAKMTPLEAGLTKRQA